MNRITGPIYNPGTSGENPLVPMFGGLETMTPVRTQLNVKLSERHGRILEELSEQYGSISSAVRIALEQLYRDTFPERSGSVPTAEPEEKAGARGERE